MVTAISRTLYKFLSLQQGILEPFSKVLSHGIQHHMIKYHFVVDLCYLCNKAFTREREKHVLTRMVVFELVQALKFKTAIPDSNFLLLVNFVLQDAGGMLPMSVAMEDNPPLCPDGPVFSTSASEVMKQHLGDALEFLSDFHTLSKIKSYSKGLAVGLNEDTIGGILKSGIAQFVALEMMRGNGRDNRAVVRNLPWLYNVPSSVQQGPREFLDCVCHVRLLSWILLGALTHASLHAGSCLPIPQDASCNIADHIQIVMTGFAEQSKASVLHMSSLFHSFVLCQLWTVYLEQTAVSNIPNSEAHSTTMSILFDFWGKVTPGILQLVSHTKLAEMVSLHFLSLMEALLECNSAVLPKLMPLWTPVLLSDNTQIPGHLQVRLQNCCNYPPTYTVNSKPSKQTQPVCNAVLLRWLQRLQFKMGQIELQSSTATHFYSV